jgi:integrase
MGRTRKSNPFGLDPKKHARLTFKHGAFYYVHKGNQWEALGTDLRAAKRAAEHYNDPSGTFGTMAYFLDAFIVHCSQLAAIRKEALKKNPAAREGMAERTYQDYAKSAELLKAFYGKMTPISIKPHHKAEYLDIGVKMNRPVRANRDVACMSACLSWLIRTDQGGLTTQPFIGTGIRRNRETKRARYVTHAEYQAIFSKAHKSVRTMMALVYRTLQRPEDIIRWDRRNIIDKNENGVVKRVIRNVQGKTGATVDIEITQDIETILKEVWGDAPFIGMTLIHTKKGEAYSYSGLSAMLKRTIKKCSAVSFGFYDLKGKGATDMWLSGVPLEQIQVLCAHDSVTTTERYVKSRWTGTVSPNQVNVGV